jgi:uncharacterized damage-inducible protein DinB
MDPVFEAYMGRLEVLHREAAQAIGELPAPALDWSPGPEMNSLDVLVTHLTGAERYWIGDVAGREPSGRDRAAEFTVSGRQASDLQERLAATLAHSRSVLEKLTPGDLAAERADPREGRTVSVAYALLHALEHTALHVGHIQIVRQLLDQRGEVRYNYTGPGTLD